MSILKDYRTYAVLFLATAGTTVYQYNENTKLKEAAQYSNANASNLADYTADDSSKYCGTPTTKEEVATSLNLLNSTGDAVITNEAMFLCRDDIFKMMSDADCQGIYIAHGLDGSSTIVDYAWQSFADHSQAQLFYQIDLADKHKMCYCWPCCSPDSI